MPNENAATDEVRIIYLYTQNSVSVLEMSQVRSVERVDNFRAEVGKAGRVGWIHVDEGDAPVYRLAALYGSGDESDSMAIAESRRIVILESVHGPWGLMVDRVSQVTQIPASQVLKLPDVVIEPRSDIFTGLIISGDEQVLFIDPEKLRPGARKITGKKEAPPQKGPTLWELRTEEGRIREEPEARRRVRKDRRTARRGESDDRRGVEYGQVVIFSFAKPEEGVRPISYGLSMRQVAEILGQINLLPVPLCSQYVMGLINWQGTPTPMISLSELMGTPGPRSGDDMRFMVARDRVGLNEGGLLGFPVYEDVRTVDLPITSEPANEIYPINYRYVRGVVELENETLIIPDIGAILFESKIGDLAGAMSGQNK